MGMAGEPALKGPALPEPKWYAVHTKAGQETVALESLKRAGYWTFYAFERVRKMRRTSNGRRRLEWKARPYFSRYVFVALRSEGETLDAIQPIDWQTGIGMEGISTLVRSQVTGAPLQIQNREMDMICERAMVRFGDDAENPNIWLEALMREIQLDEARRVTLFIGPSGRRQITSEDTEQVKQAQAARTLAQPLRRAARP